MYIFISQDLAMTKNYDLSVEINHNLNCPNITDYSYIILIIGSSGSGKVLCYST